MGSSGVSAGGSTESVSPHSGLATPVDPTRPSKKWRRYTMLRARLGVLLLLVVFLSIQSPVFFTATNLVNVLLNMSVLGIIAAPLTLLLVARQVDLSVGSAIGFAAAIFTVIYPTSMGALGAVAGAFAAAMLVAMINAIAITRLRVNSLIATLATLAIFRGAAKLIIDGKSISVPNFGFLGTTRYEVLGLAFPLPVLILAVVAAFFIFLMKYTIYGRHMYASGSNPRASRLAGLKLERGVVIAFVLTGACVGLASILQVSKLGSVGPTTGQGLDLLAITGIILGGCSLAGGRGTVTGTMVAIAILAVLDNGLTLLGISSFWQEVVRGSMLLAAVVFDQLRVRRLRREEQWEL